MLRKDIDLYVERQRVMGFKFRVQNSLLQNYAEFAVHLGDSFVRNKTVLAWARLAPSPAQKRNRLLTVRRFAIAMQGENNRYEIPPAAAFGHKPATRKIRSLFSPQDIKELLTAASKLKPTDSLRPITYTTFFALLSASGVRSCEAIALNIEDFTVDGLSIRSTKFRKDRLVPLHKTSHRALQKYLKYRMQINTSELAFFVSNEGRRLCYSTINANFLQIARSIGLRGKPGESGASIHDLRHGFAVRSLETCGSNPADISRHITALSTYLGHAHVSDAYWYLQATPKLLRQISTAQERHFGGLAYE